MRELWNDGWQFVKLSSGSSYEQASKAQKRSVTLPHDWLIENASDLYETADAWYFKAFFPDTSKTADKCVFLDFDGVYMDADILLDGQVIATHRYGYTPFFAELKGLENGAEHEIAVHIRHISPNSRWYSGSGIYRDVQLLTLPERHMVPDGFRIDTVREGDDWKLLIFAELRGEGNTLPYAELRDSSGAVLAGSMLATDGTAELTVQNVIPWSPEEPALYTLSLALDCQREIRHVGFRETAFRPDSGFYLNGKHLKLQGVCLHHDLGALGSAFHEKAAERQLRLMKNMGVNAIRTSHNPPARKFLDLCDRLGLMVIDELYDMWELPKTTYDNARFFPDTWKDDVAAMVRRDRCHPSVIMWSIGNEIYDMQASERGQMWTRNLAEEVRKHDDRHAPVTFGSNYMPWEGAQKCAEIIGVPGYNYAEKYYDAHHAAHPDWVIYGSETASLLFSRGIYHFPMDTMILSEEDLQCSALLNSNTSWGALDLRKMLVEDRLNPYSMGQFIWSGTDYIGEPTPYHTRSCYFGQADTAGFPKDSYYLYQAFWSKTPMVHIGIYWDWNEGQMIDVPVMTNAAAAELFLNGVSLGRKRVNLDSITECLPVWRVPYEKGVLAACAYDEAGNILCREEKRSFGESKRLVLTAERTHLMASSRDMAFVEVSALDANGNPVENACDRVHVKVSGNAVLLGMDNGDSTDRDGYKVRSRRLFNGKLLLIIGALEEGKARVTVESRGLVPAELTLNIASNNGKEKLGFNDLCVDIPTEEDVFIRRIELKSLTPRDMTPNQPQAEFRVRVLPENAMHQEVSYSIRNAEGVEMPCATAERDGTRVIVRAKGDGAMYLRATAANGYPHTRVMSVMELTADGFGKAGIDPYEFVAGALSDIRIGEITPGNDRGVAFARDGFSVAGFGHVDFGPVGSDEITIPVFALNGELYRIGLWDGIPDQGGRQITTLDYQKPSIWNVYQEETYRLPEVLRGVHDLCFTLDSKVHLKGFRFTRQSRAMRWNDAASADRIYGDSFRVEGTAVRGIGNNVTLDFGNMEFAHAGTMRLVLRGLTPLPVNTVHVRITGPDGEALVSQCAFRKSEKTEEQTFDVNVPQGNCNVAFVFLPGSEFDFDGFRFEEA
jgi:beta-galactosidase